MKIICIDFDGVLHSYTSGWKGPRKIPDPPVPGAIEWLMRIAGTPDSVSCFVSNEFQACIYSSRSKSWGGRRAMKKWLLKHGLDARWLEIIKFPVKKPAAYLTIDDRAICFDGIFPSEESMRSFKPWNKR
jgi:hypothetical protein